MKKSKRKKQIMVSALKLFAQQGFHATSVTDIIKDVGVARGTFYRHFKDKQDIFEQLLEANFNYLKRVFPVALEGREMGPEEVSSLFTTVFRELLEKPNSRYFVVMVVNEASGADKQFAERITAFYDGLARAFSTQIQRNIEVGRIRPLNPDIAAYIVLGMVKEVFMQWSREDKFTNLEELVKELVSFLALSMQQRGGNKVNSGNVK